MTKDGLRQPEHDDDELLSAYIDNQLSAAERLTLERRLEREPGLRGELEELQATVALVRELPTVAPPRSFTLDVSALPRQRWSLFPPLRFATLAAALLLALTLTPDLAGMATRSAAPERTTMSAPANESLQAQEDGAFAQQPGADALAAPTGDLAQPEIALAPAAPAATAAAEAQAPPVGDAPAAAPEPPAAAEAPAPADAPAGGAAVAQEPGVTSNIQEPAPTVGEPQSSSPGTRKIAPPPPTASPQLSALRWVQIALAAALVVLAAATLWARSRES